jgi:hypothetical protein
MDRHKLTFRQFLISGGAMLALVATGCVALAGAQRHSVGYPKLPGEKIQSPEHYGLSGCLTGI